MSLNTSHEGPRPAQASVSAPALSLQAIPELMRIAQEGFGNRGFQAPMLLAFLKLGAHPEGMMQADLEPVTEVCSTSVSRLLTKIGRGDIYHNGMGLVEFDIDPKQRRRRRVRLSAKGRTLYEKMQACLAQ